jgi:hypothetical protein
VADGTSTPAGLVAVSCTVHPDGGGFDVNLNASIVGGALVTITSTGSGSVTLASGGSAVVGRFQSGSQGYYAATDCTLAYTFENNAVPSGEQIAPGRIWGHIACPDAKRADLLVMAPDGGVTNATCATQADFLFEDCVQ